MIIFLNNTPFTYSIDYDTVPMEYCLTARPVLETGIALGPSTKNKF